jgi:hypothetical protein
MHLNPNCAQFLPDGGCDIYCLKQFLRRQVSDSAFGITLYYLYYFFRPIGCKSLQTFQLAAHRGFSSIIRC